MFVILKILTKFSRSHFAFKNIHCGYIMHSTGLLHVVQFVNKTSSVICYKLYYVSFMFYILFFPCCIGFTPTVWCIYGLGNTPCADSSAE